MAKRKRTGTGEGPEQPKATRTRRARKPRAAPGSKGLSCAEVADVGRDTGLDAMRAQVAADGGAVLGAWRDPYGGHPLLLAALPLARVHPTPFQRDLSEPHADRLARAIDGVGRFLDPIVAVFDRKAGWWTPNGLHRTAALARLGARSVVALVVPEREVAYRILALNTEKAHTLREKALEAVRMARDLAGVDDVPETGYAVTFEDPAFVTLGLCYEARPRFSGGAYHPVLKRTEAFLDVPLREALAVREARARRLLELDDAVVAAVAALKARGLDSPYLKAFVVARVNPLRFSKAPSAPFDATLDRMLAAARAFDAAKVKADQVARSGGPPPGAEG